MKKRRIVCDSNPGRYNFRIKKYPQESQVTMTDSMTAIVLWRKLALRIYLMCIIMTPIFAMPWVAFNDKTDFTQPLTFSPLWRPPPDHHNVIFDLERLLVIYTCLTFLLVSVYLTTSQYLKGHHQTSFDQWCAHGHKTLTALFSVNLNPAKLMAGVGFCGGLAYGVCIAFLYRLNPMTCLLSSLTGAVLWGYIWAFLSHPRFTYIIRGGLFGGVISSAITHTIIIFISESMLWDKAIGCFFLGGVQGGVLGLSIGIIVGSIIILTNKVLKRRGYSIISQHPRS